MLSGGLDKERIRYTNGFNALTFELISFCVHFTHQTIVSDPKKMN